MKVPYEDQEVYVGIRPEGFVYNQEGGVFTLMKDHIEVMGRDKSVVATHEKSTKPTVRCIIDSQVQLSDKYALKFDLKPEKVFVFNKESEMRLR